MTYRILLLEDQPADAELIQRELTDLPEKAEVRQARNREEFIRFCEEFHPDIILSDYSLPGFSGIEALKWFRKRDRDRPFIIITSSINEETAAGCIKAGATDYVTKEHLVRLLPAVTQALVTFQARKALRMRDRILRAVKDAAHSFLSQPDWQEIIPAVLADLGEALDVDRVYLFRNSTLEDGTEVTSQIAEWVRPPVEPQMDNPDLQNVPWIEGGFGRWLKAFQQGRPIAGPITTFPPEEQEFLAAQQIQSLLCVPVTVAGRLWGFIGFDDCTHPRQWEDILVQSLQVAADTIAVTIQREETNRALREQEAHYQDLYENAPDLYDSVDPEGIILNINRTGAEMLGYRKEELIGQHISRILPPEDWEASAAEFAQAARDGTPVDKQITYVRKDGSRMICHLKSDWVRDEDGKILYSRGVARDITQQVEDRLRLEQLSRSVEQAPVSVIITDVEGNIEYVNPTFEEVTGYSREEALGQNPRILKSGAHDAAFYKNLWDTILAGKTWQGDICNQRKDGSLFWESATISGLLNDQSVVTHFIAVKQEITERVELNTRLQQRTRAFEKLAEVVMDLNDCKSSETLFQMTVEGLVEVTKADRAALLTPDENHEVQFRAWKGLSEDYRKKVRGHFPWKWNNVQAQPIFIDDVSRSDLTVAIKSALKQEGVQSCGFFPLIGDQSLLGKIMVYYNKPHTFTAEEIHTLNILSRNVATILERLGTVHALEESTDRYRKLFDNAPLAIGIHQRGKWVRVNHYLVRMLGYSSYKDLIGQPVLNVVHPEERKAVQQRLQKMAETGEPALPREEKLVRRDGSTVIALVTSSPIMYRDEPAFEASGVDLTPLKHSLEALEESEARYENLLNSAPIGIAIHQEGKIVVANPYMAAMYGYSQEELIGKPIMDLLHPKSRKAIASRITAMEHDGEAVPLKEHLALHKDGSSFPVLSAGVPVTYRGRPAIEITVADLTPIKETEKALRESEAKYRSIFENSHEIIGITTVDGDFVDINPVAETILGYTREELLAMNTRDLYVDPDTGDRFIEEFKTRGYIGDFEARLRRKDGNILDCLLYATPRRDEEGRVIEFQGIIRDVTEQKKADRIWQTLRQLSRRLSDPLALDEIGPVVAEEARRLFDYDAFSLSIVDQETQMVEGFYNEDLLPGRREPSRVPTVRFPLQSLKYKALLTGKSVAVNRSAPPREKDIHQFGTRRYSRSLLYAPIMREQEMIGLVSVQSYTAGKFNEEDLPLLETFANSLSGAIRRAQQRKQLMEALEKAREGERVKTLFLANMSHEIRTPLNSILGFVQLIESSTRDLLPPEQQEFFDYVNDSAERLMRTVHEILDLSQIEAGAMKVQPKQLSVKRLCALVVEEQRPKAEEKGLTLVFKPTPAKDLALLDKNAFQQIVANLVDNAIKYTETGGITVTERVRKASILLDIKDTGIGIGDRYIRRMFEPFTQESEGYTKKFQGIGLGLALVKNYCELNQIHIAVTSEVGKGTVFTLTIPRVTTS